jgi:5-methylcytosine-specific restriction endonuclease McrA
MIKKPKGSNTKAIKKDLDKLWSKITHEQYDHTCSVCGLRYGLAAHHFFGKKAYPAVKWDIDNGVLLCVGCHIMKVHRKGQTEIARDALIGRIGQDQFDELKKRANQVNRYRMADLIALKVELTQILESFSRGTA